MTGIGGQGSGVWKTDGCPLTTDFSSLNPEPCKLLPEESGLLKRIFTIAWLLVFTTIGVSCALNPVTGRQEFVLVSEQQEIEIGKNTDPDILEQYGYYPDTALQDYVRSIGESLARVSHRPSLAYRFKVVDSPSINAFALPGGYVYVTRGILAHLNSEAELASVLGHEIGHVTERHAVQQLTASMGLQVLSLALSESFKGAEQFSQVTNILFSGVMSGYGRSKEFSSDRLGQGYMVKAGYDPYAAVGVLATLQRNERNPLDPITHWVVSSHPYTSERIQRAVAYAGELDPQKKVRLLNRDHYLHRIDGLIFGAGERGGMLEGERYQNRYFRISCNVPKEWKVRTERDQWEAVSKDQNLRLQLHFEEFQNSMDPDGFATRMEKRVGLNRGSLIGRERKNGMEILKVQYRAATPSQSLMVFGGYLVSGRIGIALYGMAPESLGQRIAGDWNSVLDSIQRLTEAEAKKIPMSRIKAYTVRGGDTFRKLAERFLDDPEKGKKIAEINGMEIGGRLTPGTLIKVIGNYSGSRFKVRER